MQNRKPYVAVKRRRDRRGVAAVEFAVVAPLVFLLVFGGIEFARAFSALHTQEEAARQAVRVAVLHGTTVQAVRDEAAKILAAAGISQYTLTVDPDPPDRAAQWSPVTVTITTDFRDVSWLAVPIYLGSRQLVASSTLPREAETTQN